MKKYVLRGAVLGAVILLAMFQARMTPSGIILLLVLGLGLGGGLGYFLGAVRKYDENAAEEPDTETVHEDVQV